MRPFSLLIIGVVLALPAGAQAGLDRFVSGAPDSVSLTRGRGTAVFVSRDGAILGTVARGRLTITDLPGPPRTMIDVSGCERRRRLGPHRIRCAGRDITFSILDGTWAAAIQGRGINASAVLTGTLRLKGRAGTYSLRGGPEYQWPRVARIFVLGS